MPATVPRPAVHRQTVSRQTIDLSAYPDLVVIYLGLRVNTFTGLKTAFGLGPQIDASAAAKPDGLLLHERIFYSFYPANIGMRQYWRDMDSLGQAIRHVTRTDSSSLIDYATPLGNATLRDQLQGRITQLGIHVDASQILITNGASQALDMLMRYMLKAGDTVFVEDPGYYNLNGLMKLHGVRLVGIPRTRNGPDLDAMQAQLKEHRPRLFVINTVFHNPTGTTIAPPVAFRLLQLAREHHFTIIEDDIYADFQSEPTDRLATLDQLEHVVYVGGLSKTLSSSLRIGYLVASPAIVKDLADVKMLTSIGGSRFAEAVTVALLERGMYRKHLERLRRRMYDALGQTVQTLEESGWKCSKSRSAASSCGRACRMSTTPSGSSNAARRSA